MDLPEQLAHPRVDHTDRALLMRLLLFLPAEPPRMEVEELLVQRLHRVTAGA